MASLVSAPEPKLAWHCLVSSPAVPRLYVDISVFAAFPPALRRKKYRAHLAKSSCCLLECVLKTNFCVATTPGTGLSLFATGFLETTSHFVWGF